MKLVFTGIQGCGKGTQARLLVENHGYRIVEMWTEFRTIAKSDTELGRTIKSIIDSWKYVDEELWRQVMKTAIEKQTWDKIIFDGFIRSHWNKEIFDEILPDYTAVFFELSEEKAKQRLIGRMYNTTTWETFVAWTEVDPETGEKLVQRKDDNEEWILSRIQEYVTKTLPVLKEQKEEWKVIEVNADQPIADVYAELVEKLELN